jgi:hypothetical protein
VALPDILGSVDIGMRFVSAPASPSSAIAMPTSSRKILIVRALEQFQARDAENLGAVVGQLDR